MLFRLVTVRMSLLRDRQRGDRIDQQGEFTITVARYLVIVRVVGAFVDQNPTLYSFHQCPVELERSQPRPAQTRHRRRS